MFKMWSCRIMFYLFSFLFANIFADLRIDPLVDTSLGLIRGLRANDGDYSMFMGIPFAKIKQDNPFGEAIPQEPFRGVFEAYDDSVICPQIEEFNMTFTETVDCLHLNIYVPDSANSRNRLPVLLWIYGGGFSVGFSGRYLYGPKYIVRHDVILVTINYRLGPYGFMCLDTPDVPGNQGFKDQLLALRWVKENIEAFGGDSTKITAFGESAGGVSIDFHLLSSHEKLFNQIIIHSGTTLKPTFREPVKNAPIILAQYLGFDTDDLDDALQILANLNPNSVIAATTVLGLTFGPCVEKEFDDVDNFISQNWINAAIPKVKNMPVLIGFNNQESLFTYGVETATFHEDLIKYKLSIGFDIDNEAFEGMDELVRQFYMGDQPITNEVRSEIIDFDCDYSYNHPTFRSMKKYIENGAGNIFFYIFSYAGKRNFGKYYKNVTYDYGGAAHSDELGYLFDMLIWKQNPTDEDQLIIDRMTTMWTNFVKHGDPTPELSDLLTTKWMPIIEGSPHHYLEIDRELSARTRPFSSRMTFWDLFYKTNHNLQRIYPGYNVV